MNTLRFACGLRCMAAAAAFLTLSLSLPAKEKTELLLDFTRVSRDNPSSPPIKCYQFSYGDWGGGKVIDINGKGTLVQSKGGKGGLGENKTMLKLNKTPILEINYLIGNANQAGAINFSLTDRDGTEQNWSVPLTGLAKGIDQRFRIDLTKPSHEAKPGKTAGLDLAKLESWQVRGDWSAAPVEVLLLRVLAIKEK
jgi:hypothetical protein